MYQVHRRRGAPAKGETKTLDAPTNKRTPRAFTNRGRLSCQPPHLHFTRSPPTRFSPSLLCCEKQKKQPFQALSFHRARLSRRRIKTKRIEKSSQAITLTGISGSGNVIRTHDTSGMNRMLWPAELCRHMVAGVGFEPTTFGL